jgi:hypothetical protein
VISESPRKFCCGIEVLDHLRACFADGLRRLASYVTYKLLKSSSRSITALIIIILIIIILLIIILIIIIILLLLLLLLL